MNPTSSRASAAANGALCCSTLQFGDHSREATLQAIASLGFTHVDIWASGYLGTQDAVGKSFLARHLDPAQDPAEKVREELAARGLALEALSIYRSDVEAKIARIEYAAQLGAPMVIFCADRVPYETFVHDLRPVVARAEALGVRLAIENHIERPIDTIAAMERLVRDLASPAVGFTIAPPHLVALGESPAEAIRLLGPRVFGFYLWDLGKHYKRAHAIEFGPGEEQVPGQGQLDFAPMIDALREVRYTGSLNIALHGMEGWPLERIVPQLVAAKRFGVALNFTTPAAASLSTKGMA